MSAKHCHFPIPERGHTEELTVVITATMSADIRSLRLESFFALVDTVVVPCTSCIQACQIRLHIEVLRIFLGSGHHPFDYIADTYPNRPY